MYDEHTLSGQITQALVGPATGVVKMQYDAWDRLVRLDGDNEQLFHYDALGQLIEQSTNGAWTDLWHAGSQMILETTRNAGGEHVPRERYVHSPVDGLLILRARETNNDGSLNGLDETLYALHDAEGSVIAITDASGDIVQQFAYDVDGGVVGVTWGGVGSAWSDAYDWVHLWRQMRLAQTKTQHETGDWRTYRVYGDGAGNFYAPGTARRLNHDSGAEAEAQGNTRSDYYFNGSQFDGFLGLNRAWHQHANAVVTTAKLGIVAGVTWLSGGSLTVGAMAWLGLSGTEARYMNGADLGEAAWGGFKDGTLISSVEALATGRDQWTGDQLEGWEYALHAGALVLGGAPVLRAGGQALRGVAAFAAAHPLLVRGGVAASLVLGAAVNDADGAVWLHQAVRILRRATAPVRHWNGAVGERLMGRWLRRFHPNEVIVAKPGAIGSHGADWITVNAQYGRVSLWDAKFRSLARRVRMSSTFAKTGNLGPLQNAVGDARVLIGSRSLTPMLTAVQRNRALQSIARSGTGFDLHTVGFGRATNWVRDLRVVRWW